MSDETPEVQLDTWLYPAGYNDDHCESGHMEPFTTAIRAASEHERMTWLVSRRSGTAKGGNRLAAIVPVEFGVLAELLMRRDTRFTATITAADGTSKTISGGPEWTDVGPTEGGVELLPPPPGPVVPGVNYPQAWACRDETCPLHHEKHDIGQPGCIAAGTVAYMVCRNCGKSQAEHCTFHFLQHCPEKCYGEGPHPLAGEGTANQMAWEWRSTWTGTDQRGPAQLAKAQADNRQIPAIQLPASRDPEGQE